MKPFPQGRPRRKPGRRPATYACTAILLGVAGLGVIADTAPSSVRIALAALGVAAGAFLLFSNRNLRFVRTPPLEALFVVGALLCFASTSLRDTMGSLVLLAIFLAVAGSSQAIRIWPVARNMVVLAFLVLVLLGILIGDQSPSLRYSGAFQNPNSLGVMAALFASATAHNPAAFLLAGAIEVLTASRTGALALLLALAVEGRRRLTARYARYPFLVAVAVLSSWLFVEVLTAPDSAINPDLVRSGGSRTELWGPGLDLILERPWTGYGYGVIPLEMGSSLLSLCLQVGVPGAMVVGFAAIRWFKRRGLRPDASPAIVCILATSALEGYLFNFGSVLAWSAWFLVIASRRDQQPSGDLLRSDVLPQRR